MIDYDNEARKERRARERALLKRGLPDFVVHELVSWALEVAEECLARKTHVVGFTSSVKFADGSATASLYWPEEMGTREAAPAFASKTLTDVMPWLAKSSLVDG